MGLYAAISRSLELIKTVDFNGKYSSEIISNLSPGARVVKAFKHLEASVLAEPEAAGGKRVLFYPDDDAAAKIEVT